jgi:hypothetical protein
MSVARNRHARHTVPRLVRSRVVDDPSPPHPWLRSEGACEGCSQVDGTILGLIEPAVHSAYPGIVEVLLEDPAKRESGARFEHVAAPKRRRLIHRNRSCH